MTTESAEPASNIPQEEDLDEQQAILPSQLETGENNFTFENRIKQTHESPIRNEIQQHPMPAKIHVEDTLQSYDEQVVSTYEEPSPEIFELSPAKQNPEEQVEISQCHENMFSMVNDSDEEPIPEEKPNNPLEQSLNLDTIRGHVEVYDKQNSMQESVDRPLNNFDDKNFYMIRPATEKRRMIALPKNNEPVNISDMLSRSFVFDDMSERYDDDLANGHNSVNQSMNFANISPEKLNRNMSSNNLFTLRQNEVLEQMEKEHMKILDSQKRQRRDEL